MTLVALAALTATEPTLRTATMPRRHVDQCQRCGMKSDIQLDGAALCWWCLAPPDRANLDAATREGRYGLMGNASTADDNGRETA